MKATGAHSRALVAAIGKSTDSGPSCSPSPVQDLPARARSLAFVHYRVVSFRNQSSDLAAMYSGNWRSVMRLAVTLMLAVAFGCATVGLILCFCAGVI
jgi:hypothetical protein